MLNKPKMGALYLIPNLLSATADTRVISDQVRSIITAIDVFVVESRKAALRYLKTINTTRDLQGLTVIPLRDNETTIFYEEIMPVLVKGRDIGMISDAGCPAIADPGSIVITLAHRQGLRVIPLAGPCSIILALMASGFSGQNFAFIGYLPIARDQRRQSLLKYERRSWQEKQTQIFMETPYRNNSLFADILAHCHELTEIGIACDLTLPTEFIQTHPVKIWRSQKVDLAKRPTIFSLLKRSL